jgi:phasin
MQDSPPSVVKMPEFPVIDMPKFEESAAHATSAFREFAEKGLSQAKEAYAKMKTAAEETTGMLETTYANASKGTADYGLKVVEMARVNSNAAFDFTSALLGARTLAQMVEISTSHARKQIELATEQAKELAALAQKVATDAAEPIKGSFANLGKKAA